MKIVDRYLISNFLKPMVVCGAIFAILVLVGHFFDKMSVFNDYHANVGDITAYLILGLPYWLNVIFPVVTLLSLMFSLGPLQARGEITALRSAGISSLRLYAPFFAVGFLISIASLMGGTKYIPSVNSEANIIYRQRIKKEPAFNKVKDHIVVAGRDGQRFTIGMLDIQAGTMKDVVIDRFDDQMNHLSTLSAREGQYQNGPWLFSQGNLVQFDQNGISMQESFAQKVVDIHERPADFVYDDRKPDDMTHSELVQRIRHLNELGVPAFREKVALHLQFSLPFANVIVILIGIPFALNSLKKGNVHNIAYAVGATFLYWGTVSVFQSYGEQGYVPAWIAAWAANIIFGTLSLWKLRQALKL